MGHVQTGQTAGELGHVANLSVNRMNVQKYYMGVFVVILELFKSQLLVKYGRTGHIVMTVITIKYRVKNNEYCQNGEMQMSTHGVYVGPGSYVLDYYWWDHPDCTGPMA